MPLPASASAADPDAATPRGRARALLHPLTLALPRLPAALAGLRLLHVTDLHVRRPRPRFTDLLRTLEQTPVDLLLLTGDFMTSPGDEKAAEKMLRDLLQAARSRLGIFAVWGNHDTHELRNRCHNLPLRWLNNDAATVPDLPLTLLGLSCGIDECRQPEGCLDTALAAAKNNSPADQSDHATLLLSHVPSWLTEAAHADVSLMLSGHTHGGQIRLPFLGPLLNMTPNWPLRLSSGVLRHRDTYAVVSRGIGESVLDGLRLRCPPHAPLITLQNDQNPTPPLKTAQNITPWKPPHLHAPLPHTRPKPTASRRGFPPTKPTAICDRPLTRSPPQT